MQARRGGRELGPARTAPLLPGRGNPGLRFRVSLWILSPFFRVCFWRGVGKGRWAGCEGHVPPRVDRTGSALAVEGKMQNSRKFVIR